MTIGRPTQPLELKRLKGTLRTDRLPPSGALLPLQNTENAPEPRTPLGPQGQAFWHQAWNTPWFSQLSDYWLVLITAQALDEREEVKIALAEEPSDRRLRATLRELDKQVISAYSLMGYTPSDRSRLGLAEVKKESKLEELIRRKNEKSQPVVS